MCSRIDFFVGRFFQHIISDFCNEVKHKTEELVDFKIIVDFGATFLEHCEPTKSKCDFHLRSTYPNCVDSTTNLEDLFNTFVEHIWGHINEFLNSRMSRVEILSIDEWLVSFEDVEDEEDILVEDNDFDNVSDSDEGYGSSDDLHINQI